MIEEVNINSIDITILTQNIFDQLNTDESQHKRVVMGPRPSPKMVYGGGHLLVTSTGVF
jgi:hypothetical protein